MDRLSKKKMPELSPESKSNLVKWVQFICAGAALGVGIVALREMKNIQSEIAVIKRENNTQKLEKIEEQIFYITNYINEKRNKKQNIQKKPEIKPETQPPVVQKDLNVIQQEINIINEDEYEEVEVTDDES